MLRSSAPLRYLVGLLISAAFLYVTATRVDLTAAGAAIAGVAPIGLAVAFIFVWIEIGIRAYRWKQLLREFATVPLRSAFSYLCVGYFANTLLPARLGDVARAYLAGTAFGIRRLGTLGTILVERLADGATMLAAVLILSLVVPGTGTVRAIALWVALVGAIGLTILIVAAVAGERTGLRRSRPGAAVEDVVRRVLAGAGQARRPVGLGQLVGSTLAAFAAAVVVVIAVAGAVGMELSPLQAAMATSGLALSLAIPAGPAAIGTYEFIGVVILTGLGLPAAEALATVVLVHVIVALPPAIVGLAFTLTSHLRLRSLVGPATFGPEE